MRPHAHQGGRDALLRPGLERRRGAAHDRRCLQAPRLDGAPLAALAGPRHVPRPPVALPPRALRPHAQGPDLRAERRASWRLPPPRCRRRPAASATGTTATAGSATRRSRCGASTPSASTGRPTTTSPSSPTSPSATTSSRSCTASTASARSTSRILAHLSGYEGASPVRIGNAAYGQRQHDMWGAVLDSVYLHTKSRDHLDERIWPILTRQVEAALEHWREPDRGIWEVRGEPKHFTCSKVMCWVAADRGARLARLREDDGAGASAGRPPPTRSTPTSAPTALDERGVFTQHYETDALDASRPAHAARPLPAARRRADPAHGPRHRRRADRRRPRAALPHRGDR